MSPPVVVEPVDVHQSRRTTPAYPRQRECRARRLLRRETRSSPEAGAETPALLLSTSISLPPGSVETAALRQEQAPPPVSVSWLRVVQQTQRVLAHDGIPAIELTVWWSRWPGRSPRRSSSCGGRGTIPFDGMRSPGPLSAGDRIGDTALARIEPDLASGPRLGSPTPTSERPRSRPRGARSGRLHSRSGRPRQRLSYATKVGVLTGKARDRLRPLGTGLRSKDRRLDGLSSVTHRSLAQHQGAFDAASEEHHAALSTTRYLQGAGRAEVVIRLTRRRSTGPGRAARGRRT